MKRKRILLYALGAAAIGTAWGQWGWRYLPAWLYLGISFGFLVYAIQWSARSLIELRRQEREVQKILRGIEKN